MVALLGTVLELLVALACVVIGLRHVRRADGASGWLLAGAGAISFATCCGSIFLYASLYASASSERGWVAASASLVLARVFVGGLLLLAPIVRLARRLDAMRGPRAF